MAKKPQTEASATTQTKSADKYRYIYTRKSVERRVRRRRLATVFLVFVLVAMLFTGTIYAVLSFVDNNNFRITIERGKGVLMLSEEANFGKKTSQLTTRGPSEMTDMTYSDLPLMRFRTQDGSYSVNDSYYASSFYLTNLGDSVANYREVITLTDSFNSLDDCIRVLVIRESMARDEEGNYTQLSLEEDFSNMHYTCYGKAKADGSAEQVAYDIGRDGGILRTVVDPNPDAENKIDPWMCTNFSDSRSGNVTDAVYYELHPDERVRYTIVVWIEGTDEDTVDARVGGRISMKFGFTTTSLEEQTIS